MQHFHQHNCCLLRLFCSSLFRCISLALGLRPSSPWLLSVHFSNILLYLPWQLHKCRCLHVVYVVADNGFIVYLLCTKSPQCTYKCTNVQICNPRLPIVSHASYELYCHIGSSGLLVTAMTYAIFCLFIFLTAVWAQSGHHWSYLSVWIGTEYSSLSICWTGSR